MFSAAVILTFFVFVFVFTALAESEMLSGVPHASESSSSSRPSSRLAFCSAFFNAF